MKTSKELGYSYNKEIGNILAVLADESITAQDFLNKIKNYIDMNDIFVVGAKSGRWKDWEYSTLKEKLSQEEWDTLKSEVQKIFFEHRKEIWLYQGNDQWEFLGDKL